MDQNIKAEYTIPYDMVKLPSLGKLYKENKSSLKVEDMITDDEDILLSNNLINSGKVFDVLLKQKVKDEFDLSQLLIGDKNKLLLHLRQTAYGQYYNTKVIDTTAGEILPYTVDLSLLGDKELVHNPDENGEFEFVLPKINKVITFRLLRTGDEDYINKRAEALKNKETGVVPYMKTRLETQIMSIEGDRDRLNINTFVKFMSPQDSVALRRYIDEVEPNVNLEYTFLSPTTNEEFKSKIQLGLDFFYPNTNQ